MTDASRERSATSADVARESGFSRATVSYVLNETPNKKISPATRAKIRETAERLGHVPNPLARALKNGRSNIVVCLIPALTLGFIFDRALDRLTESLAERGYALLINRVSSTPDHVVLATLWSHITPRLVIAIGVDVPQGLSAMTRGPIAPSASDAAIIPHERIGEMQALYMLERGHTVLGYAMPSDPILNRYAKKRLEGVRQVCRDAGVSDPSVKYVSDAIGDHQKVLNQWSKEKVTAICAHNDDVALTTWAAMQSLGLRAPRDFALVGADDVPLAQLGLTTIALDVDVCGSLFVHDVLDALGESPPPRNTDDVLRLVVRSSA
jgi:DNA-binding LacI/PurR family transcriptional regulator